MGCLRFMQLLGLGFGVVAGGGLVYAAIVDPVARTVIIAMIMFIAGALIVGSFIVLAIYAHARALSGGRQTTTYNYPAQIPTQQQGPWEGYPPALPAAARRQEWANLPQGEVVDNDGHYVA